MRVRTAIGFEETINYAIWAKRDWLITPSKLKKKTDQRPIHLLIDWHGRKLAEGVYVSLARMLWLEISPEGNCWKQNSFVEI